MSALGLDRVPEREAAAALERCCGAAAWVRGMLARRPFGTPAALHAAADEVFATLGPDDLLEAFAHHPRIGDVEALRQRFAATAEWASGEQRGAAEADEDTLRRLAAGNAAYEQRHGHIFIVCATGLSAGEILARLEARLHDAPEAELRRAGEEQRRITHLRLDKLMEVSG